MAKSNKPSSSRPFSIDCSGKSPTEQHHRDSCDVGKMVQRARSGVPIRGNSQPAITGDFSGVPDFYDSMVLTAATKSKFECFPAKLRARFDHDPMKFVKFLEDPTQADAIAELGMDVSHLADQVKALNLEKSEAFESAVDQAIADRGYVPSDESKNS